MLGFCFPKLVLIIFFLPLIVELAVDGVVVVGLPVFLMDGVILFLYLMVKPFLVVLLVYACDNVVLLLMGRNQFLFSLQGELHLAVFEIELWKLLIVYHVVGVPDGAELLVLLLLHLRLGRVQVHDVEVFFVLRSVFLSWSNERRYEVGHEGPGSFLFVELVDFELIIVLLVGLEDGVEEHFFGLDLFVGDVMNLRD